MELKEELSKLGIAPGRRRKAELVQALQEALDNSKSVSSGDYSREEVSSPDSNPGTDSINGGQCTDQLQQQPSHAKSRPRTINFVDVESLDEEQKVDPLQSALPPSIFTLPWLPAQVDRVNCFHSHPFVDQDPSQLHGNSSSG